MKEEKSKTLFSKFRDILPTSDTASDKFDYHDMDEIKGDAYYFEIVDKDTGDFLKAIEVFDELLEEDMDGKIAIKHEL